MSSFRTFTLLACSALASPLVAASLKVSIHDPTDAVVAGAVARLQPLPSGPYAEKPSGVYGVCVFESLSAGAYRLTVNRDGFRESASDILLAENDQKTLEIHLELAPQQTSVEVTEKTSSHANSNPDYRAVRSDSLDSSFLVENLEFTRDAGVFTFRSGTISFGAPVLGRVALAVFSGKGLFHLAPTMTYEQRSLNLITGKQTVDEEFDSAVLLFSDDTYRELKASLKTPAQGAATANVLEDFRHRLRHTHEDPRSFTEALFFGTDAPNVDAELLADLYNPGHSSSFTALIHGEKHSDLRFFVKPAGAVPAILSTEEVGLVNIDPGGSQDGIWYLTHYLSEWKQMTLSSDEDRRIYTPLHYKIETVIGKRQHLDSVAAVKLQALRDGDRVVHFDLLPSLRVSRVTMEGKEIDFVQEPRKQDSSFYVILPAPTSRNDVREIQIEYRGDKVIREEGGGSFSVGARESWYPSLNVFRDRCTYDLTFKVPKRYTLVSVGRLTGRENEADFAVTHWMAEVPIAVAGFNYGEFKEKSTTDSDTKYEFETYATTELPDYLRRLGETGAMSPSALSAGAMVDAENSIRCYKYWFGDLPYGRIAITEQPEFNFGQSWPSLVYLPIFSFLDSTQRYMLLKQYTFLFNNFIQEVAPHEVAHQWWGHLVGWCSYHDQWLSEGFADFSASLFLEATEKKRDKFLAYWEHARKQITERNNFGNSASDAGPLWMGIRLDTFKTGFAYNRLVYSKGGFILQMLRYLMRDPKTGDSDFIAMMHDFTSTYSHKNASTEDFTAVLEKHMKPQMNLAGDGHMAWFFGEWVYGTEIPSYHLAYHFSDEPDGKVWITCKVTQSGVSDHFMMRVPVYLDFDLPSGPVAMSDIGVMGKTPSQEIKVKLPRRPKRVLLNYNHDVLARDISVQEY